jgi:hypothetical protein
VPAARAKVALAFASVKGTEFTVYLPAAPFAKMLVIAYAKEFPGGPVVGRGFAKRQNAAASHFVPGTQPSKRGSQAMKDQTQLNKINPILLTLCLLSVLSSVSGRADIIRPYAVTASGQYNTGSCGNSW